MNFWLIFEHFLEVHSTSIAEKIRNIEIIRHYTKQGGSPQRAV